MHVPIRRLLSAVVAGVLLLPVSVSAQTAPAIPGFGRPTQQELATTKMGGKDWITYGGAVNNDRYSSLTQIDGSNVANLKGAWMTRLNSGRGAQFKFEAYPLVIGRGMYVPTGNDRILAHHSQP